MLNWKIRYSNIMMTVPELLDPAFSVVEVGSGSAGIAQFLRRNVIGVEPTPMAATSLHLEIVKGSILALPFPDDAIDYVLCVDMLEHLPARRRKDAIAELCRITKRQVIISCPCDVWAEAGELQLKDMFQTTGVDVPAWLHEHLALGLPSVHEMLVSIAATGYPCEVKGNETILQHYAGIALDWLYPAAQGINNRLELRSPLQPPIGGNEWDLYYSFMFDIKKSDPKALQNSSQNSSIQPPQMQAERTTLRPVVRALYQKIFGSPQLNSQAAPIIHGQALYAVYHKVFPFSHLGPITPIFVGDMAQSHAEQGLTDVCHEADELSNRRWSELSAIHKIWAEGPKTSVVGFCHYRRLFDFTDYSSAMKDGLPLARETIVTPNDLAGGIHKLYDPDIVSSVEDGSKIIVAVPHDTKNSIFENYCENHNTNDYLELINQCFATKNPLLPFFFEQFSDHFLFANNMFILSWELFSELSSFWFEMLNAFVEKFPDRQTTDYQRRDVAFLSERIFDAWIRYRKQLGNEIIHLPILFVLNEAEQADAGNRWSRIGAKLGRSSGLIQTDKLG